jgi:hypothetical protein
MGILDFFADRERKAEHRESKDEMLVGEVVRAMAYKGWPVVSFQTHFGDEQRVTFRAIDDPVLSKVYITLDRKTGSGAISSAIAGSKATLRVACEVKNYMADPDDLLEMYQTDLANLTKLSWGDIEVDHQYNAIQGETNMLVDIDDYVDNGEEGVRAFVQKLDQHIGEVREKLEPYKKSELDTG